jgi:AraC family transcriptional regulator of adaptative response/methylated-DNA-[protein]-cysteine methyltransferase
MLAAMSNDLRNRQAVERACRLIETRDPAPSLAELAREAGFSAAYFQKLFVATVGVSPKAYGITLRRRRLTNALHGAGRVTEASYDAGYAASSAAYRDIHPMGMKPSRIRRGGAAERIRCASARSSLGPLMIAATQRGLCAVEFGAEAETLEALQRKFPQAVIEPADRELEDWVARVVRLIDQPGEAQALPLDIRGTAFQTKVWRALTRIPVGTTLSYAQVAERIGAPGSARAVARACASNSVAVVVPCHRVVRTDGSVSGYRWGVQRKRALLAREAAAVREQPRARPVRSSRN